MRLPRSNHHRILLSPRADQVGTLFIALAQDLCKNSDVRKECLRIGVSVRSNDLVGFHEQKPQVYK